jgi:hypothetical protein
MGVISGACLWDEGGSGTLNTDAAILFMRAQAAWLHKGLQHADDSTAVGIVLGAHDTAHESWLGLIAAVHRCLGDAAAQEIATLYSFCGRVVGCLERGPHERLEADLRTHVHELLASRLESLTDAAVSKLQTPDEPQPLEPVPG